MAAVDAAPSYVHLREACAALFTARASDAHTLMREERGWPPRLVAHPHWSNDYDKAARQAGVDLPPGQAVDDVNAWIELIESAGPA